MPSPVVGPQVYLDCEEGSCSVFLQVGASMMDPNHFLMIVLSRFELFHIFTSAECRKRYREANKVCTDSADSLLTLSLTHSTDAVTHCKKRYSLLTAYCLTGCGPAEQHSDRRDASPHHHGCGCVFVSVLIFGTIQLRGF